MRKEVDAAQVETAQAREALSSSNARLDRRVAEVQRQASLEVQQAVALAAAEREQSEASIQLVKLEAQEAVIRGADLDDWGPFVDKPWLVVLLLDGSRGASTAAPCLSSLHAMLHLLRNPCFASQSSAASN